MTNKVKTTRNLKVIEQSGYRYQATPTVMLKGKWLSEFGFEIGTHGFFNALDPLDFDGQWTALKENLGSMGEKVWIAKTFNCDNGKNIHIETTSRGIII